MRVVVTGCAGFIGSRFCEYLLETKELRSLFIIGIDDLSGGYIENVPVDERLLFIKADLSNKEDQKLIDHEFKKEHIDYIFHYACFAPEGLSNFMRQYTYTNSVLASVYLINCGIKYKIKRFIFTSSNAVYGEQVPPFDENMIPQPVDSYGISKYCVEMDLKVAYTHHHMEYTIIRPRNVFGIKQNILDPYRNVIGIWMYQILNNLPITIYGDGNNTRSFSYIDDILPCLLTAAIKDEAKNQIINLGSFNHISLNDIAKIICKITNTSENNIIHLEQRHEVKHAWSSYQKSIDILNYTETTALKDALTIMWTWAKNINTLQPRKYFTEYEIDNKIYSYWKK